MNGLELINTESGWYWRIDYRFDDDSSGVYAESILYESDRDAIKNLLDGTIIFTDNGISKI